MTIRGHTIFEARQLVLFSAAAIVLLVFVWTTHSSLTCRAEQVVAECPAKRATECAVFLFLLKVIHFDQTFEG